MFIKNGIAYAENREPILTAVAVRPLENYNLWVKFSDGAIKQVDLKPFLNEPVFKSLKTNSVFNKVYVDYGCVVWNDGEIDIAPETLYHNGVAVSATA